MFFSKTCAYLAGFRKVDGFRVNSRSSGLLHACSWFVLLCGIDVFFG